MNRNTTVTRSSTTKKPPQTWPVYLGIVVVIVVIWFPKGTATIGAHAASFRIKSWGLFGGFNTATVLTDHREKVSASDFKHTPDGWKAELVRAVWQFRQPIDADPLDARAAEKDLNARIKEADKEG